MGFLGKLNQKQKYDERKDLAEKFAGEPIWVRMQKVMETMRAFYAVNWNWIQSDPNVMAVLEDMRKDFEAKEAQMTKMIDDEKAKAHDRIEEAFGRLLDKKTLQLQLRSMEKEYKVLVKMAKLRTAGLPQEGGILTKSHG